MAEPTQTVGETKTLLGTLLGLPREQIEHYVIVAETAAGTCLKFCCDDRRMAAALLLHGADLVMNVRGESANPGVPPPPMPGEPDG